VVSVSAGPAPALLRHQVHHRLCAPAAAVGASAVVVLRAMAELHQRGLTDTLQLTTLLLALATVTAVADPAGSVADAGPTPLHQRRLVRAALVLATVAVGWAMAVLAVPAALRPPTGHLTVQLVLLCLAVLAAGSLELRHRAGVGEPRAAVGAVAMAWTASWLLRPDWSPLASTGSAHLPAGLALAAGAALVLATADPARRWRRHPDRTMATPGGALLGRGRRQSESRVRRLG
jgi:hypothetical protein